MSQTDYDPNNVPETAEEHADAHALLSRVNVRLDGIILTLPTISVNEHSRARLVDLREEVKGHLSRLRGDLIRERRAENPD